MDRKKMEEMSGENQNGGAPKLVLNQIRFNGKKGTYFLEDVKSGLVEKADNSGKVKKTYTKQDLGSNIEVVFLKIRRRLYQFKKDEKPIVSTEHNHKGCKVLIYGGEKNESGFASDFGFGTNRHPNLKTQQIIYALYNGELVRLFIKGASLGSKVKPKEVDSFYSYIARFKGKDDHFYEHKTILTSGEEEGDLGPYYVMNFARGEKLGDTEMEEVEKNMEVAFEHCKEADEYFLKKIVTGKVEEVEKNPKEEMDTIEYPERAEDEIDPEDIPF